MFSGCIYCTARSNGVSPNFTEKLDHALVSGVVRLFRWEGKVREEVGMRLGSSDLQEKSEGAKGNIPQYLLRE